MKSFRRSRKALSPVVASIILIAVTVAVSIAVAVWMGALTTGFMATEQVTITNVQFGTNWVSMTVNNTATTSIVLNDLFVNNIQQTTFASGQDIPKSIDANTGYVINATVTTPALNSGSNYALKVVSAKGNPFSYTATMP
jgi:flagellin-like protein